jgi:hypothetical protein
VLVNMFDGGMAHWEVLTHWGRTLRRDDLAVARDGPTGRKSGVVGVCNRRRAERGG